MKVKALMIFMVLLGLVIFDGAGTMLLPIRTHSPRPALHTPTIVEPDGAIKRKILQTSDLQSSYFVHAIHKAILNIRVLSSPTDRRNARPEYGRAPPLRI
jgi:hypothetical protein